MQRRKLNRVNLPPIYKFLAVCLRKHLDVEKLQEEVELLLKHNKWTARQRKNWHAIPLRSFQGGESPDHVSHSGWHYRSASDKFKDTSLMKQCPYIAKLIADFQAPVYKARAMKMDANSNLATHRDTFPFDEVCRIHIVVKSNEDVKMTIKDTEKHFPEGEMWFTNVREKHSVQNNSDEDRIHIVFDVDWCEKLSQLLAEAIKDPTNLVEYK